jgi:hypothetical protein
MRSGGAGMSQRLEKTWADVLAAVHGHHKGLVDEGTWTRNG